uniref:Leucine-rich repeat, immunoglobulin-like and transmembrane domains 3b n=1 Tax=Gouania willdenowi TaxID=441366 RepID=A0A8C5E7H7_GOUWI
MLMAVVPVSVPADAFKLRLERTLISTVPRAAFYNLAELRYLWLTYNSITSIHPSSFVNLKALREMRVDGNLLSSFPWEGLRDTPQLQILSLHNNRLSILPPHAALFLHNVTYLDLSSNRPTGARGPHETPGLILCLHDNPWLCDCQISMLMSLCSSVGSPAVLMDPLLMCSRSLGQAGMLLTQTDFSRCTRPSVQPAATKVVSPLGSNVILRCDATGYPTPTLTWIKTSSLLTRLNGTPLRGTLKMGDRWSIISLNALSYRDAGEYRCQARNMAGISEAPIKLRVIGIARVFQPSKKKSRRIMSKWSPMFNQPTRTLAKFKSPVLRKTSRKLQSVHKQKKKGFIENSLSDTQTIAHDCHKVSCPLYLPM